MKQEYQVQLGLREYLELPDLLESLELLVPLESVEPLVPPELAERLAQRASQELRDLVVRLVISDSPEYREQQAQLVSVGQRDLRASLELLAQLA